jgi:hypothetical protein
MPEEVMVIAMTAIICGTLMLTMIIRAAIGYQRSKHEKTAAGGSSLTTSELQRLMRAAVEEGTQPLLERIDELEAQLQAAARQPRLLPEGAALSMPEAEQAEQPVGARRAGR